MLRPIVISIALALASGPALSDATLDINQATGGPASYQVHDGIVRMAMQGPNGQATTVLYDSKSGEVTNILEAQKVYAVLDQAAIRQRQQQVQAQMRQMMPQMEQQMRQQMQSMPPQQRQMVEQRLQAMRNSLSGGPPNRLQTRATGRTETVAGYQCRVFDILDGDQNVGTACVADAGTLSLSSADFKAITSMFSFMQGMSGTMTAQVPPSFDGIPLKITTPDGRVASNLTGVDHAPLDAALFTVPAGYQRMDPSQGAPAGGR